MPTCRVVIAEAMRAIKAIAPGDDPEVDELAAGLEAAQSVVLDLHEARGPLIDVDITAATWIAGENQRIRIQAGDTATVTLPNAVAIHGAFDPYDYGFDPAAQQWLYVPEGTTGAADGVQWRQPHDGTRIEIVGTTQALYFYRADLNQWMAAYGLTLDGEIPLNARYQSAIGALLAERLMEVLPDAAEPTPGLRARIQRGRSALLIRPGVRREPVRAQYL